MSTGAESFLAALTASVTVSRAFKVCLVVGTLLIALNHADTIISGQWPAWWKIVLTYLVPYSVSSYSTAMFIRESKEKQGITRGLKGGL